MDLKFLQTSKDTAGKLLEMEATYHAHSKEPAAHYHPFQSEDFKIISGSLHVRIDGHLLNLHEGDSLHIPRNKVHAMWNAGDEETIVNWKVQPAGSTEYLLETMTGLANDGRTNEDGMPNLLQISLTARKYASEIRLATIPFAVQKILFLILSPVSRLLGYQATDKKYID